MGAAHAIALRLSSNARALLFTLAESKLYGGARSALLLVQHPTIQTCNGGSVHVSQNIKQLAA